MQEEAVNHNLPVITHKSRSRSLLSKDSFDHLVDAVD